MFLERLLSDEVRSGPLVNELYRPAVTLHDRSLWEGVDPAVRDYWITRARRYLDFDWPELTRELYDDYRRTGERRRFEAAYHKRRQVVATLLLGEGFENQGTFLAKISEGIAAICSEPTWVLPAHLERLALAGGEDPAASSRHQAIDIFCAETGSLLAWSLYVLGGDLASHDRAVSTLAASRIRDRLVEPYLHREDLWWMGGSGGHIGNWTTWCTSSCLGTVLLTETSPDRRWRALEQACRSLDRFQERYHADGGCDEGPTYWNFAAGCLYDSLELLYEASAGSFDLFDRPVVKKLGTYIRKVHVHELYFVNFSDCPPRVPVDAALIYRYGRRIGDPEMAALGAHLFRLLDRYDPESTIRLKINRALATLADEPVLRRASSKPPRQRLGSYLEKLQVVVAREHREPARGLVMAAKGGWNADGHNHNDVGNVLVYLDGRPVLVDAGMKQYTKASFDARRYRIWAMQSAFHNVPLVNGMQQGHGRRFGARSPRYENGGDRVTFRANIAPAYPREADLLEWVRECSLDRQAGHIRVSDAFEFEQEGSWCELRFLSACRPSGIAGGVRLRTGVAGSLSLRTTPAPRSIELRAFRLHDPVMVHSWGARLYQVRLLFEDLPRKGELVTIVGRCAVDASRRSPVDELDAEDLD